MVAVDAVIIEVSSCNNALIRYRTQRAVGWAMSSSSFVATTPRCGAALRRTERRLVEMMA
jgi:hypothetical protein